MDGGAGPRARSLGDLLARLSPPEVEPRIRDLVKRPTPHAYRHGTLLTPEQRLREGFALTAFAHNLGERVREARS